MFNFTTHKHHLMQCSAHLTHRIDESWTQTRKRTHPYTNVWCKGSGWSLSCAQDQTVTLPSSSSKHPVGPEIEGEGVRRDGRRCYLQEQYLIKCQKCCCLTASKHAPLVKFSSKRKVRISAMIPRVNFVNKGNNEGKTPEKKHSLASSHPPISWLLS